jgi:hypothetical protein
MRKRKIFQLPEKRGSGNQNGNRKSVNLCSGADREHFFGLGVFFLSALCYGAIIVQTIP